MQPHPNGSFSETDNAHAGHCRVRAAFAAYATTHYPGATCFTVAAGMRMIAAFTGVPAHEVIATLHYEDSFTEEAGWGLRSYVPLDLLSGLAEALTNAMDAAEAWWSAPGVRVYDAAAEESEERRRRGGVAQMTEYNQRRARAAWSSPLPRPTSSSFQQTTVYGDPSSARLSAVPTNTVGSTTRTAATGPTPTFQGTPLHFLDEAVAAALIRLGVPGGLEALRGRRTEAERHEVATAPPAHAEGAFRLASTRSPLPPSSKENDPHAPMSPAPASVTLVALQNFVHRGREVKVCRQFVRKGSCSFGARCLFHHPSPSAATNTRVHDPDGHGWNPLRGPRDPPFSRESEEVHPRTSPIGTPALPTHLAVHLDLSPTASMREDISSGQGALPTFSQTFLAHARKRWPEEFGVGQHRLMSWTPCAEWGEKSAVAPTPTPPPQPTEVEGEATQSALSVASQAEFSISPSFSSNDGAVGDHQ